MTENERMFHPAYTIKELAKAANRSVSGVRHHIDVSKRIKSSGKQKRPDGARNWVDLFTESDLTILKNIGTNPPYEFVTVGEWDGQIAYMGGHRVLSITSLGKGRFNVTVNKGGIATTRHNVWTTTRLRLENDE